MRKRKRKRKMEGALWLLVVVVLAVVLAPAESAGDVKIWPMPASVSSGNKRLHLSKDFELLTQGTGYNDASGILKDGFNRMLAVVNNGHVVDGNFSDKSSLLSGLHALQYGIDESYKLMVPSPENQAYAHLEANTVFGALHGLQTFSQLCHFNYKSRVIEVHMSPWTITDQPRFSYRGLLIDTSRHYLPLPVIKNVIDSMTYAKLNTSFVPDMVVINCCSYAQKRGINVMAELDVPGHALSWRVGYPALWPSNYCQQPLDVSNEFTFQVIDGILSDFSKIFKFKFVHLGGDKVNTSCWTDTPCISKWLKKHHMNESQAYQYFVLRAQNIALSHGYEIVNWEETFNNFGNKLGRKTVVHNWLRGGVAQQVVASGLRCIVSNQDKWYLDHLDTAWQEFYMNEPFANITNSKQQKLVIGGEVCMWDEHIDGSDIEQTIWPRAAAAAERLWTPYDKLANDASEVTGRLAYFRCLLNQRGVAAAPLSGPGRVAPF
ncbi:hypothetical protein SLEP1_g41360 [Rubroshorea leprosula]|uniref:Beta-hexosaminidase n=1 Tax=Rubroshorea leprosula TaxID=152421 RepID=A0AAV5L6X4_9ROSI|nr:hypothetical protein SLEP1_g41360 [Rubroshorea leprosula]